MANRKKTSTEAASVSTSEATREASRGASREAAAASTQASTPDTGSIANTESGGGKTGNKVTEVQRSSLELRVLPSFDPRVKWLVEMMRKIDNVKVEGSDASATDADQLQKEIEEAFSGKLKEARMDVKIVRLGSDTRPKTMQDRIDDFLPVAAKIIKGKHPDYIGWLALDKETLGKNMERYIDFFYGADGKTPGTAQSAQIGKLLDRADVYFDKLINEQKASGEAGDNQSVGLANIEAFLAEAASESGSSATSETSGGSSSKSSVGSSSESSSESGSESGSEAASAAAQ